jgi:tetratricopeptide (TPR) repeat protein
VEFRVLGPVDALAGGQPVALGRRRERCLLALLLLEPGVLVPVPRLIDLLWGEDLPDRPRKTLQVHVSRLRAALAAPASDAPASVAHSELGAHSDAVADFTAALALHERSGNRTGEARTHANLGNAHRRMGSLSEARRHCHAALTLFDATDNPGGRATALNTLGEICQELGEHTAALAHHRQAADLHRELADANSEATALANLGAVCRRLGQPDQAADHYKRAAELYRLTDDEEGAAAALAALTTLR